MRVLQKSLRRIKGQEPKDAHPSVPSTCDGWERVSHFATQIQQGDFMKEIGRAFDRPDGFGLMGTLGCATLCLLSASGECVI
jgi:hypothetical protein